MNHASDDPPVDAGADSLTPRYSRLSLADLDIVARLHAAGRPQSVIAAAIGCSQSTVSEALRRLQTAPDLTRALMSSQTLPQLQQWKKASRIAATRGDHRPAKEWLETAQPQLRPVTAASAAPGGITIVIGTPQAPLALPDVLMAPEQTPLSAPEKTPENTPQNTPPLEPFTWGRGVPAPAQDGTLLHTPTAPLDLPPPTYRLLPAASPLSPPAPAPLSPLSAAPEGETSQKP